MRTVRILGQEYPARYSLRAAIAVGEKYGSIGKALLDNELDQAEALRRRCFVLREMIKAGKIWAEAEDGATCPELPTEEELMDRTSFREWTDVLEPMLRIINEDDKSDFEAEASEKNAEATPGR